MRWGSPVECYDAGAFGVAEKPSSTAVGTSPEPGGEERWSVIGIARGRTIELEEPLPYRDGQEVSLTIEPVAAEPRRGSAAAILKAMHEAPPVRSEDVDAMMEAIESGKLPVNDK